MSGRVDYHVRPGTPLTGRVRMPGDKSISHRALLLASLAQGESTIEGLSGGADVAATARALAALGIAIEASDGVRCVHGGNFSAPGAPLDLGNSGTSVRLLLGALSGQPFATTLCGDASLSARPMGRVLEPLARMGGRFRAAAGDTLPVTVQAGGSLHGIHYRCPVPSAQVKSALLLAGLRAAGRTVVAEPVATRDHTERMLRHFGVSLAADVQAPPGMHAVGVTGPATLAGRRVVVPGDFSAAAFFIAGACLAPGSDLTIERVGINPTRIAALEVFRAMGALIDITGTEELCGEPTATLRVRYTPGLRAVSMDAELAARAIDELPVLLAVSACLPGATRLRGAAELRVKESDRIAAVQAGLEAVGIPARALPDGLDADGVRPRGGTVASHRDHRIVMAFAMLALAANSPVTIEDCAWVQTSFPEFAHLARTVGMDLREERGA